VASTNCLYQSSRSYWLLRALRILDIFLPDFCW
jgi:hypothetical protein